MSRKNITVSIIIVHYNKFVELKACLASLKKYPLTPKHEIIVVNNGKKFTKGELSNLKKANTNLTIVASGRNIGYGGGNNLGAKHAAGKYVLILNPDTQFKDTSPNKLIDYLEKNPRVVGVSPNLLTKDGILFIQLGSRKLTPLRGVFALSILNKIFPNNQISKKYWMFDTDHTQDREVDVLPGSGMVMRKKVFDEVGGYDENFFLYFEESDLCKRIKDTLPKSKFLILAGVEIIHDWQPKNPGTKQSSQIFAKSRFYYFKKHYGILAALVVEFFAKLNKYAILILLATFGGILIYLMLK